MINKTIEAGGAPRGKGRRGPTSGEEKIEKKVKKILYILGWMLMVLPMVAQNMVYLEHCETLSFDQKRLPDAQLLKGNVRFRHDEILMFCDSAYFYEKNNSVDAFGHVRFIQGDTLEGLGEVLYYDGNTRLAKLCKNVVLTHVTTVLNTDILYYNRNTNIAYYSTGGTITDADDHLSSVWGSYNVSNNNAEFSKSVHLQNKSLVLDADTLVYNTDNHIATLVCPTVIVYEDSTTILSSDGWYNTSNENSMLLSRSRIIHANGKQLTGDTIYYDRKGGIGNVFGHMEMKDTVERLSLLGNYGIMYEQEKSGFATDSAYMLDWSQTDSTFVHADTLFTEQVHYLDTMGVDTTYRRVRAFFNVRGYSKEYQFVCDSMDYTDKDSIVSMYGEPVCWNEKNQVSADTIRIYLNDSTIDYIHGIGSAFCSKQEGPEEFDQLSGKEMKAYIQHGELKEIAVSGNAETVFYPRNDDSTYVGVNKSQSSYVTIFLEDQKIHHVLFTTETKGTLYPLSQIDPSDTRLLGFFWADRERPKNPKDIFARPKRTERPKQKAISATDEEEEEPVIIPKERKKNRK